MLLKITLLALASSATLSFAHPGNSFNPALHHLTKRQSTSSSSEDYTTLYNGFVAFFSDALAGDECQTECSTWVTAVTGCTTDYDLSDYLAISNCICATSTLSAMTPCGTCLKDDETVTGFAQACKDASSILASLSASGLNTASHTATNPAATSRASATASGSASIPSRAASSTLTDNIPTATEAAGDDLPTSSSATGSETAAGNSAPTPTGGANKQMGGVLSAFAAVVVGMLVF